MEGFINKMGLYDIWTVLFPGVVFQVGTRTLYEFMVSLPKLLSAAPKLTEKLCVFLQIGIAVPSDIYEFLVLLILSYFCGLILHELSSIMKRRVIYRKGDPRDFTSSSQ